MKSEEKKQAPKGCTIGVGIFIIVFFIFGLVKCNDWLKSRSNIKTDYTEEWNGMTYEERDAFLKKAIEKKSFINGRDIEYDMRDAIKKECVNPKTVSFSLGPSIYNGFANVVEADSAWIFVPFRCGAKNDFGIEKEIAGSIMYLYKPETNSLEVKRWDIEQNN
jgi:hypothetical protein